MFLPVIGWFLVCAQWLSDGACSAARYHHGWQAGHQQCAGDCYSVSNQLINTTFECLQA